MRNPNHNRRWYDQPRYGRLLTLAFVAITLVILTGCASWPAPPPRDPCTPTSVPVRDTVRDSRGKVVGYVDRWEQRVSPACRR